MISVFGSQVSPRLMSSLRVGMPIAGCQVRVARTSGDGVAGNGLLVFERHAAVGLLDRLPAADSGRPAAQGHLALAHEDAERREFLAQGYQMSKFSLVYGSIFGLEFGPILDP